MAHVFSAPGKALLAGGYLVLDSYDSYAIALSARMYCVATKTNSTPQIVVRSPQFQDAEWKFLVTDQKTCETKGPSNPFLRSTIESVARYLKLGELKSSYDFTIYSDKEFHSQFETEKRGIFCFHHSPIDQVPKTGLGSSAALVTVFTAALLSQFMDIDLSNPQHLNIIHNLAQLSHCEAQGKVGSGFDVAAATFGSIVYRRFDPVKFGTAKEQDFPTFIESNWEIKNERTSLPQGIRLLMGDIEVGSNTPGLVSKVSAWKKKDPELSARVYADLDRANLAVIDALKSISKLSEKPGYPESLRLISTLTAEKIGESSDLSLGPFKDLVQAITTIRENMRTITKEAGAPIEPSEQTTLLDSCLNYPGVIGGVVPGAGGFDAICVLIADDSVQEFIISAANDDTLRKVRWLDLRESADGLKAESLADISGELES